MGCEDIPSDSWEKGVLQLFKCLQGRVVLALVHLLIQLAILLQHRDAEVECFYGTDDVLLHLASVVKFIGTVQEL